MRQPLKAQEAGFTAQRLAEDMRQFIPKRRAEPVRPWAQLTQDAAAQLIDEAFDRWLPEYWGCQTAEMVQRPVPHTIPRSEVEPLQRFIDVAGEAVFSWALLGARVTAQAYERRSKLGYPYFSIPDDKASFLMPDIERILSGDLRNLDSAFCVPGIRLQPELPSKMREFMFVTADGEFFADKVELTQRFDARTGRLCSRTRLIFNYPVENLVTQIVDNAVHKGLLGYPMFQRDMYGMARGRWRTSRPCVRALDLKHCERFTGYLTPIWARFVGGMYGDMVERMYKLPFLCAAVGAGKDYFAPMLLTQTGDRVVQLGSGLSVVSQIQKQMLLIAYASYLIERRGATPTEAIHQLVTQQGDFAVHNYGDDNFVEAESEALLDDIFAYLAQALPIEVEDPPAFLGMQYSKDRGFFLRWERWLINWLLNERAPGSRFRRFPEHGWRDRNRYFTELGDDRVPSLISWFEGTLLPKFGVTAETRLAAYKHEELTMLREGAQRDVWQIALDKRYLLTEEEKAAMPGFYSILSKEYCQEIYNVLLRGAHAKHAG